MKNVLKLLLLTLLIQSCKNDKIEMSSINPINWEKRTILSELEIDSSLIYGRTYLSVYSQIYSETEQQIYNLTATVSMRNTNYTDTIYLRKAEYFDTKGNSIRTYFDKTIFISPMETVEIVIDEKDQDGGTGANFVFDWIIKENANEPLFESVMISTYNRGLSFTTNGKKIR